MKTWQWLILGIFFFFALLYSVGLFLDEKNSFEKEIIIEATPEEVFPYINDLKKWEEWSPWIQFDPDLKLEYSKITAGVGAEVKWDGPKADQGTLTIVKSVPYRKIETVMNVGRKGIARDYWILERIERKSKVATKLKWGVIGDAQGSILGKYYNLMLDKFLGPQIELGLKRIKEVVEKKK